MKSHLQPMTQKSQPAGERRAFAIVGSCLSARGLDFVNPSYGTPEVDIDSA